MTRRTAHSDHGPSAEIVSDRDTRLRRMRGVVLAHQLCSLTNSLPYRLLLLPVLSPLRVANAQPLVLYFDALVTLPQALLLTCIRFVHLAREARPELLYVVTFAPGVAISDRVLLPFELRSIRIRFQRSRY